MDLRIATRAGLALSLLFASAASARGPELPRELRGRVAIEVKRCRPIGRADALLEAEVLVRAKRDAVALPGLHCGAYDDEGAPFFLTPVTGRLALRERESKRLTVRFAADAEHRECGCTVRSLTGLPGEDAGDEPGGGDAEFDAHIASLVGEAEPPAQPQPAREEHPARGVAAANESGRSAAAVAPPLDRAAAASGEAPAATENETSDVALGPPPFAPPALRYERMLAPDLPLRAEPHANAAITGSAATGARLAVDRIERGWKLARTSDGSAGWLPGDASTADVAAPERMAERLVPLHAALSPAASRSEALCASVERSALSELVAAWRVEERAVYVRPLWHALAREDRDAFQTWAADCFAASRVIDAMTGREIHREQWEPR